MSAPVKVAVRSANGEKALFSVHHVDSHEEAIKFTMQEVQGAKVCLALVPKFERTEQKEEVA